MELRKKITRLILLCEVTIRGQLMHVDTCGHVAMECKQGVSVAKWTPVDTDFYVLVR